MGNPFHRGFASPPPFDPVPHEYRDPDPRQIHLLPAPLIPPGFRGWLALRGIRAGAGRIFRAAPGVTYRIHADGPGPFPSSTARINIVVGGAGSTMTWYGLRQGCQARTYRDARGDEVTGFDPADCEELFSCGVTGACVVNVGVPHTLTNPLEWRTCYSMFAMDLASGEHLPFDRVVSRLAGDLMP
ncbi:MAG: hypothetical protein ABFD96_16665 [Armatimonadia bacterium]